MKDLRISPDLSLPPEAVTNTHLILARRRVGKSYTAAVMAEEMVKAGLPWVALDPTGVWWGLTSSADGTLRDCTVPGQPCPNKPGEWKLRFNVKETLARYDWTKTGLGIASNQAGISLGFLDEQTAYQLLNDMVVEATSCFAPTGSLQICPHGLKDGCSCRKPAPGMLNKIMRLWGCLPDETLYVGDMESDRQAAENGGCDLLWAHEFFRRKSRELWAENNKFLAEALRKIATLMKRATDQCMHCGRMIQGMEKIGQSVYARPCGCRLWQGTVPDVWKN